MPAAVFLGKPSPGFMCCYITLTQTIIAIITAGVAVSLEKTLKNENDNDPSNDLQSADRRIGTLIGILVVLVLTEFAIILHISILTIRSKRQIRYEHKRKQLLVEQTIKDQTVRMPSMYEVIQ
ncbi:Transmembrane_domain-containing protein [Hexamita inflata]|uniref:Transmembrane domain-containing protein n=1 Tax=Hexamita inflata TaxID=28002 RepID=A0AA86R774_9EUKA|nr:Transmembrane domain-containing protein [Hexamita inflata]CAI9943399.1 Transmembrane domain-containing protein [Hexamita inflata]CAI9958663.1 Transmembrane domain-containing protein [Hexamita inflata]CAI9963125.1 Transmembrane domain-containing protein [Hexamita inflata]CAI9969007.1 Transmembrane domain-containing protein [Hexamita inflata]